MLYLHTPKSTFDQIAPFQTLTAICHRQHPIFDFSKETFPTFPTLLQKHPIRLSSYWLWKWERLRQIDRGVYSSYQSTAQKCNFIWSLSKGTVLNLNSLLSLVTKIWNKNQEKIFSMFLIFVLFNILSTCWF